MNPAGNSWHGARPYTIRVNLNGGELEAARDIETRADTGVAAITRTRAAAFSTEFMQLTHRPAVSGHWVLHLNDGIRDPTTG